MHLRRSSVSRPTGPKLFSVPTLKVREATLYFSLFLLFFFIIFFFFLSSFYLQSISITSSNLVRRANRPNGILRPNLDCRRSSP